MKPFWALLTCTAGVSALGGCSEDYIGQQVIHLVSESPALRETPPMCQIGPSLQRQVNRAEAAGSRCFCSGIDLGMKKAVSGAKRYSVVECHLELLP